MIWVENETFVGSGAASGDAAAAASGEGESSSSPALWLWLVQPVTTSAARIQVVRMFSQWAYARRRSQLSHNRAELHTGTYVAVPRTCDFFRCCCCSRRARHV